MADTLENTWTAKAKRTITAVLPVAERRRDKCINCGACCKLPNKCLFIKPAEDGKEFCSIYSIRPLNCRKYPRTETECVTQDTCGFTFE